ncbi:MAG: NAD(P)/FAD-dependent oxidoreductase [Acidimicrobiia bacterium]
MLNNVVIVGTSLAGLRAAETLRVDGYDGEITMINGEAHAPYDRPPLSKKVLSGEWDTDRIALRKGDTMGDLRADLRNGVRATALDTGAKRVSLSDGTDVPYDAVLIATGAHPRRLANQPDLEGIHALRTLDDAMGLKADLAAAPQRVVVIGAGFIGAEVASTAKGYGLDVTVLEALPVPLARGLGERMGMACGLFHGDNGVELRLGVGVEALEGAKRVERVRLTDGTAIDADVVVVGVGVVPTTQWLDSSGLELRDGVVCDATLCAGPPGVYAAGDLVRWPNGFYGEEMRIEHWTNASEQGVIAAKNILATAAGGTGEAYSPVPFFWSDQYGRRIQFLGRGAGTDDIEIVHGSIEERKWVAVYSREGRVRGALGIDLPRVLMPLRQHLLDRSPTEVVVEAVRSKS